MWLHVLGSSGTAPRATNPASGYLVRSERAAIWMDAGPGTYMALLRHLEPTELGAVLLSHMYADHSTDLFALLHDLRYVRVASDPVLVIGPDGTTERIASFLQAGPDHAMHSTLQIHEAQPGEEVTVGDVTVAAQAAHHSVPALAFRLSDATGALGYTGDTGPSEMVTEHVAGVDVLLAEATLQDDSESMPFHMTARQAGEMAAAAAVGRLLLTHIPASLDPTESLLQASAAYSGPLSLAAPGDRYMIAPAGNEQREESA